MLRTSTSRAPGLGDSGEQDQTASTRERAEGQLAPQIGTGEWQTLTALKLQGNFIGLDVFSHVLMIFGKLMLLSVCSAFCSSFGASVLVKVTCFERWRVWHAINHCVHSFKKFKPAYINKSKAIITLPLGFSATIFISYTINDIATGY